MPPLPLLVRPTTPADLEVLRDIYAQGRGVGRALVARGQASGAHSSAQDGTT